MCVCVCVHMHVLCCVQLFVTPWFVAHQAPLSMKFSRQEYWSGLPFSSPGHLPDPGIEPMSLASPALAGGFFATSATWEVLMKPGILLVVCIDLRTWIFHNVWLVWFLSCWFNILSYWRPVTQSVISLKSSINHLFPFLFVLSEHPWEYIISGQHFRGEFYLKLTVQSYYQK